MAQLTDDCFAFSGPLLPVDEVERIIAERVVPVAEVETVPLNAARGRVIAADVVAPIDLPPFDNSAVDGYAVRHADLAAKRDTRLAVVERVTAGRAAVRALRPDEASASSPARRCLPAPTPCSCRRTFTRRRDGDGAAGPQAGRRPPARRRGRARRIDRAAGRPAACRRRISRSPPRSA